MKPLGKVLQQADLISSEHVEIALKEQTQLHGVRLGEILVSHGWLRQETADFFSHHWPALLQHQPQQPLGQYLKDAGLLNEYQIQTILAEQQHNKLRFGEIAVLKGWLKPTTIRFFLEHLALEEQTQQTEAAIIRNSALTENLQGLVLASDLTATNSLENSVSNNGWVKRESAKLQLFSHSIIKLFKLAEKARCPDAVIAEVLLWTDRQPILTQKLCRLLAQLPNWIPAGAEAATVQQIVQSRLIDNWETQVASEHLQEISAGIIRNQQYSPLLLLEAYQQILQQTVFATNRTSEQVELLRLGLIAQQQDKLKVANRIYQAVFDSDWVQRELTKLQLIKQFKLAEKASSPDTVTAEVLLWTNGQPILTQKLCRLLAQLPNWISAGTEAATVQQIVQSRLINNWETQVGFEHLQEISVNIIHNQQSDPLLLLETYQQILHQEEVATQQTPEQVELLRLGLIGQQQGKLKVANRIYQSVFDSDWVQRKLTKLQLIKQFKLAEKAGSPDVVIAEVLLWTNGQPILTHKLCRLLAQLPDLIAAGTEVATVKQLVQSRLIDNWENQVESEHLQEMSQGLLRNQQCDPLLLLEAYQQILQQTVFATNRTPEQLELLRLGLIAQQQDTFKVANRIYQSVFNADWVEWELSQLLQLSAKNTAIYQAIPADNQSHVSSTPPPTEPKSNKRFWILLIVAGLMLCGSGLIVLGFSVVKWLQVERIFKQGNELLQQGEYQQAIAQYNKLLELDSNYYQSWTNRGYALAGIKDYKRMLESCTTATIINPKAVYAWNCRGEALYNLKEHSEAIASFDRAIALNSSDPIFWINKTEALLELQDTDTALNTVNQGIKLLQQIWAVEPKDSIANELAIAFSSQAKVLLQKKEHEAALAAYEKALEYNPHHFTALRGKGIALQALRRDDKAIAQFYFILERPQSTQSEKAEAWYYLGLSLCRFRQTQKAIAAFDQALKLKPDYQAAEQGKKACSQ
jgi:tetratricopeptide (TPR) repeat protein